MKNKATWAGTALALAWIGVAAWVPVCGARETVTESSVQAARAQAVQPGETPKGLSASEWGRIQERILDAEHEFAWDGPGEAYVAPNRAHGLETSISAGAERVSPAFEQRAAGWTWRLRLVAWGAPGRMRQVGPDAVLRVERDRATYG